MKKILSLIIGVIVFSGLPFLGWGLNDVSGFIGNIYRFMFIVMMFLLSVTVVLILPDQRRGKGIKVVKRQKISLIILQIAPVTILLLSPWLDRKQISVILDSQVVRLIGLTLSFLGFLFMNWSTMILGRQFSIDVTVQENHKLVKNGPYKYVRHPRYLGIIVLLTGIPLLFDTWYPLLIVLFLIGILIWRIKDEEKLMLEEFENEWIQYKKETYALIPFIY